MRRKLLGVWIAAALIAATACRGNTPTAPCPITRWEPVLAANGDTVAMIGIGACR